MAPPPFVAAILARLKTLREGKGIPAARLERALILGPGWIDAFESGRIVPSFDVLLAILHALGVGFDELTAGVAESSTATGLNRKLHAVEDGADLLVNFEYADYDAVYRLPNATAAEFDQVVREMRDGLARSDAAAIKADSVAKTFLRAIGTWPSANPSDIWWFVVYRAFCDPFNHPATEARRDFGQSWRRTGGWALEEVLVRHYGPWLATQGVRLFIGQSDEKAALLSQITVRDRLEADKIDVWLTGKIGRTERCFGVVHVKASFAERRTDDVPMSQALVAAGYTSPLWTMDCKSGPSAQPVNGGELGAVRDAGGSDNRSAKRKDIEDDGYFSACFSYNLNTRPTPSEQDAKGRIIVCDFNNPDDAFGRFIVNEWRRFSRR
jgi:transcriptional regulator with XRE-family HTH domain